MDNATAGNLREFVTYTSAVENLQQLWFYLILSWGWSLASSKVLPTLDFYNRITDEREELINCLCVSVLIFNMVFFLFMI